MLATRALYNLSACRQVVGKDLHLSAIIGAQNLKADAEEFGIDADWVGQVDKPQQTHTAAPLDPTAIVVTSQHVS